MTQKPDVVRQEIGEGECAPSPATSHYRQLSPDDRTAVDRAIQKVRWFHRAATWRCADKEVIAYPITRSDGLVSWELRSLSLGLPLAAGVDSLRSEQ
jgi:hypothetical protein